MTEQFNGKTWQINHHRMKYLPYDSLHELTSLIGTVVINKETDARCLVIKVAKFSIPSEYLDEPRFGDYGITLGDGNTIDSQKLLRNYTQINRLPIGNGLPNEKSSFMDDPNAYNDLKASLGGKDPVECIKELTKAV